MRCIRRKAKIDYAEYYHTRCGSEEDEEEKSTILALELHDKIIRNDVEGCQRILKSGFDANSVLHFNHKVGSGGAERRLIAREVQTRPLHVAIIYRRPAVIATLLQAGASPNLRDTSDRCPLQLLLTYWPRVRCEAPQSQSSNKDVDEDRQFHKYLLNQHARAQDTLRLLLRYGAKTNVTCNGNRDTLLHIAARYNVLESIAPLLQDLTDPDPLNLDDHTPLVVSIQKDNFTFAQRLVHSGVDVNKGDSFGRTALHYACRRDRSANAAFVRLLLQKGVSIDVTDNHGDTPLHYCAEVSNEAAIHALLQWGASPSVVNLDGQTPLFKLLNTDSDHQGQVYGLELLLQTTLVPWVFDSEGRLPRGLLSLDMQELREKLTESSRQPASLQRAARHCVRQSVGLMNLTANNVWSLPGPPGLKSMILYNTVT